MLHPDNQFRNSSEAFKKTKISCDHKVPDRSAERKIGHGIIKAMSTAEMVISRGQRHMALHNNVLLVKICENTVNYSKKYSLLKHDPLSSKSSIKDQ